MKVVLTDHGKILHWAGAHHLFPVRGAEGPGDVSFARHGELEGRTPIGWQEFFPVLDKRDLVVIADEDGGSMSLLPSDKAAAAVTSDAAADAHPATH
jgi:hypothetical protein